MHHCQHAIDVASRPKLRQNVWFPVARKSVEFTSKRFWRVFSKSSSSSSSSGSRKLERGSNRSRRRDINQSSDLSSPARFKRPFEGLSKA